MLKKYILILILWYKKTETFRLIISHNLHLAPSHCIFQPTCSTYMYKAIEKYGVIKGVWIGIKRIIRCNPHSTGGYDPVP